MNWPAIILGVGLGLAGPFSSVQAGDDFARAMEFVRSGKPAQAVVVFHGLAQAGDAAAQLNLAILHTRGEGTPQDDAQAFYWAWRSRLGGEARAIALVDYLKRRIDEDTGNAVAERLTADLVDLAQAGQTWAFLALGRVEAQMRQPARTQEALQWYTVAAAFEVPRAALLRDAQQAEMEMADRLAAQAKAREMFQSWCNKVPDAAKPATCVPST